MKRSGRGATRVNPVKVLTVLLLIAAVWFIMVPHGISGFSTRSDPSRSYSDALERIAVFRQQEPEGMNPLCRLQLMTHGDAVDRAVVLVHGYTSCPQQFHQLGLRIYESGSNVLIAPMPRHGLSDRMTDEHSRLKAEELAAYTGTVVDIAQGLGDQVAIMGLSAGGVVAAWAAQHRNDLDRAVIIAPAFGYREIPTLLTAAAMNIFSVLPDAYTWWDPVLREASPSSYEYPRYSRHALVQLLRFSFSLQRDILQEPPATGRIVIVLNAADDKVNNHMAEQISKHWRTHNADLTIYEFDAALSLPHDLIDPGEPGGQIETVYPVLLDFLDD